MDKVMWPFGAPDIKTNPDLSADVKIENELTIISKNDLSANATLNLDIDGQITKGAILVLEVDQGANGYDVAMGTGIVGKTLTGNANDKDTMSFVYNGTAFRQISEVKNASIA